MIKKTLLAGALAVSATSVVAETTAAPEMDIMVIAQNAETGSSQTWLAPAMFAIMLVVLLAGQSGYYYGG